MNATMLAKSLRCCALCLYLLSWEHAAAASKVVPDLLDQSAQASVRARNAVTLAVATAGSRLVAVGEQGTVLLSDDNGNSWKQADAVPVSVALTGVQFVSPDEGWIIGHGGVVLHTADAGKTWQRQLDGRRIGELASEEARALESDDAAPKWLARNAERLVEDGPDKPLLGLYFADARHGLVVGAYGLALQTDDGGKSWRSIIGRFANPRGLHLYAITPIANGFLVAAEQGNVFLSTDGDSYFALLKSAYPGTYFGALALDGEHVLAFGLRGNAWAYGLPDQSWTHVALPDAATLTAGLKLPGGDVVLADEGGRLFRLRGGAASAVALQGAAAGGISGMTRTTDGALVLASIRGPLRVELKSAVAEVE
ncbi:YCF48-related protein [Solimonas flava]|uniref:Photosynthesis system II assembly factor Ycf48/Hcf136-like domain-containing protein n=1 Tax=uncultured bacterium UPO41 TaxID=1776966 RepID=A0A126SXV5_9BACT|nr:YCF48-related protein [Solimonas flava]AMK59126.1 hypothetical protein ebA1929 [uncultured bacterium UPO41]